MRATLLSMLVLTGTVRAADPPPVVTDVDLQPLAANVERVTKTLDTLGTPLDADTAKALADAKDVRTIQKALDAHVLVVVTINGHSYRSSIATMDGRFMLGVSAENREKARVVGGDLIDVEAGVTDIHVETLESQ